MTKHHHWSTLAEYLDRTKTSQTAFAKQLHVGQSAVSQWVLRRRVPRPGLALRIHQLTGIPLDALLRKKTTKTTKRAA